MANFVRHLGARDVKGFALKTHEGLRPSTLQAFKKAWPKLCGEPPLPSREISFALQNFDIDKAS